MSKDKTTNVTKPLPVPATAIRCGHPHHGAVQTIPATVDGQDDEWERRMRLLNPNWRPHRDTVAENS